MKEDNEKAETEVSSEDGTVNVPDVHMTALFSRIVSNKFEIVCVTLIGFLNNC